MEGSIVRASKLIDNVMDFARARLGSGIGIVPDANTRIAPVIEHAVAELRSIARDRSIEACIDPDLDVQADHGRIGQLVSNLLGNALTHGSAEQAVPLTAAASAGMFELSVANGGEPIAAEAMTQLFQPFFRGSVRPSQQGLGLGLLGWAACGLVFKYSENWQLVINTSTTIITFLMAFLIQNTRNRDGAAVQTKLDELIRSSDALDEYMGIEKLTDSELEELHSRCEVTAARTSKILEKAAAEREHRKR